MGPDKVSHKRSYFRRQALGSVVLAMAAVPPVAADRQEAAGQAIRDAWLAGRLETAYALNTQLRASAIDTDVSNGVVRLRGSVDGEVARDLAVQIAEGMPGVRRVEHQLSVTGPSGTLARLSTGEGGRSFGQWIEDVTATARVKSNLLANGDTTGLSIDVDTRNAVVTLAGGVASIEEKQLAEQIARSTDGITSVRNLLVIDGE